MVKKKHNETANDLLALFITQKEIYQRELVKRNENKNTLRHILTLEKEGYIKKTPIMIEGRKGPAVNILCLTFKGFYNVLTKKKDDPKALESMIYLYSDKLLTFKKWNLFKQEKIDGLMMVILQNTLQELLYNGLRLRQVGYEMFFESEEDWMNTLDGIILGPLILDPLKVLEPPAEKLGELFMNVCLQDKELTDFVEKTILHEEKSLSKIRGIRTKWNEARKHR